MNTEKISEKLIELRGRKRQKEIADAVGISQSTYAMYEQGKRIPSDEIKIRLATYFQKTVQEIFFE